MRKFKEEDRVCIVEMAPSILDMQGYKETFDLTKGKPATIMSVSEAISFHYYLKWDDHMLDGQIETGMHWCSDIELDFYEEDTPMFPEDL